MSRCWPSIAAATVGPASSETTRNLTLAEELLPGCMEDVYNRGGMASRSKVYDNQSINRTVVSPALSASKGKLGHDKGSETTPPLRPRC